MKNDIFLIGAGLFNLTCSRLLAEKGYKCHIYESRSYVGGNCADKVDEESGILYHIHGPHILHIDNLDILDFLSKYGKWESFHHEVKTTYKDKIYPMPINLETINKFFNINLKPYELNDFLQKKAIKNTNKKNMEDHLISLIGIELYEAFFKDYTIKQWNKHPKDLPVDTIKRIPIRSNYQSSYYKKKYSFLPSDSYSSVFLNMLDHPNIDITLNSEVSQDQIKEWTKDGIVLYSGPIDKLFNYGHGELEWRTVYFKKYLYDLIDYQGTSVVNFPELKYPYTRVCEPKHFYFDKYNSINKTLVIEEYSKEFNRLTDEVPYYPIVNESNLKLFNRYKEDACKIDNLYCVGRLGSYSYTDMENTVDNAIGFIKKCL